MTVKAGRFGVFRRHRNVANDRAEGLTSNQGHNLSKNHISTSQKQERAIEVAPL